MHIPLTCALRARGIRALKQPPQAPLPQYNVSEETLDKLVEWRDQPH